MKNEKITWVKIYCCLAAGVMLFFYLGEDLLLPCGGCRAVFLQLVVAGTAASAYGGHDVLHRHAVCGLYLPAHGGYMDVPAVEEQPDG